MLALAARWVDRFGLVLDMRSKSERGYLLAAGRWASAAARAEPAPLHKRDNPAQAFAAVLGAALRPQLRQASLPADADLAALAAGEPEHLHQWRVGLRRLRTVLAVFGADSVVSELAPALAALFKHRGAQRDQDVLAATLWSALRAAGAPLVEWPPSGHGEAAAPLDSGLAGSAELGAELGAEPGAAPGAALVALLATPAVQRLWLALLGAAQPPQAAGQPADTHDQPHEASARPQAAAARPPQADEGAAPSVALKRLWRQPLDRLPCHVRHEAARFEQLDEAQRHRLRRRVKRLRYALESTAALWSAPALARIRQRLRQAPDMLGELNDCGMALAPYRAWAKVDPRPGLPWVGSEPESFSGATEQRARKASGLGAKRSHSGLWRAFATTTGRLWA